MSKNSLRDPQALMDEVEVVKRVSILEQEDLTDEEDEDDDPADIDTDTYSNSQLSRPNIVSRDSTFGSASATTSPTANRDETNRDPTTTTTTVGTTPPSSHASKRKRRIAKMGQRAASLKFSSHDYVALSSSTSSPDHKLKQHYKIGKLIHKGTGGRGGNVSSRSINTNMSRCGAGSGGGNAGGASGCNTLVRTNIHICTHRETGIQRAVKVVKKCHRWNRRHGHQMVQEYKILKSLDHPNLVKMYDMFEGADHYYFIMDWCKGGDLCEELDAWGSLEEHDAAVLIKQVLACLSYCHTNQIVHGNIKPEHILLEHNKDLDQIKLTDFSCAEILEPDVSRKHQEDDDDGSNAEDNGMDADTKPGSLTFADKASRNSHVGGPPSSGNSSAFHDGDEGWDASCDELDLEPEEQDQEIYKHSKKKIMPERKGTPDYWAPEVVLKGSAGPKRDIWGVGVLTYLVISNRLPFAGSCQEDVCERIIRGEFSLDDNDGNGSDLDDDPYYSNSSNNLYYDDPAEYLHDGGFAEMEPFQWSNISEEAKDFIRYLLTWDEDKRPTARQALEHPWIVNHIKSKVSSEGPRFVSQGDEFVNSLATMAAWNNVAKFNAPNKLKQATCTFIAAQLVLKHEREAIDHVFRALDIYNDGRLSKKEVRIGYKECFGRELTDAEVEDLFSRVDLNGSGYIEYSEFLVASMNEKDLLHSQKIQQAFSVFDRDGSGYISRDDLVEVLSTFKVADRRGSMTERAGFENAPVDIDDEIVDRIIQEVDLAGNGVISYEEFMAMMLRTTDDAEAKMDDEDERAGIDHFTHKKATMSIDSACSAENMNALKFTTGDNVAHRPGELTEFYDIEDFIDEGGFGKVYVCKHKATGAERAVKVVNKSRWHRDENQKVLDEFNLLKDLEHPNILKMYDLFKDRHHYYIVMDVCKGGDLCDELDTWGKLTEIDTAIIMKQLLSSVAYCHEKSILHRDLKPDNILLEQNKEMSSIKIIDFALATRVEEGVEMTQRVGTAEYMAPEVVNRSYYGMKSDIWSIGVICFICLADTFPFYASNQDDLFNAIMLGNFSFGSKAWGHVSEQAKDFVSKLLIWDPKTRPTAEQALQHPWLESALVNCNREDAKRLQEQAPGAASAISALTNLQSFFPVSKLRSATQIFIASQLLLKEEKDALDEVFRDLDLSCNGKLSKAEVKEAYSKYFGHTLTTEELTDLFARVDTRNTGFIGYSEFIVAAMNEKVLLSDKKLRKAFELFDKDGNGLICAADLKEALSFFYTGDDGKGLDDSVIHNLIQQMDRDGDGFVCYDEFVAMMLLSTDEELDNFSVSETSNANASF